MSCVVFTCIKSTIVYGYTNIPGLSNVKRMIVRDSHIKNPDFVFKPLSSQIRELKLTGNDFYGVMAFNMVYHLNLYYEKFKCLEVIEFEG
jgi:hypothetical protein